MRWLAFTAPVVLDPLKSVNSEANQPALLQALIATLNEALGQEDGQPLREVPSPKMASTPVQTLNPNMRLFSLCKRNFQTNNRPSENSIVKAKYGTIRG
jgi:hypothetical protein